MLFGLFIADNARNEHDEDEQQIPAQEAVSNRHAEDTLRQREKAVAELRHERIRCRGQQHRNDRAAPPFACGLDTVRRGERLSDFCEERNGEQQLHHRKEGRNGKEHRGKNKNFLRHCDLIGRSKRRIQTDGIGKPRHGGSNAVGVVRCQAVIGVQQLHPARRAVGKAAIGCVPCRLVRCAAEELGAKIAAKQIVIHKICIVAEIAEFIVFRLKQKHVIEVDFFGIVGAVAEELAALEHDGLRLDVCAGEICRDRPRGPCAHRVTADGKAGRIHVIHRREHGIGIVAAGGAVGQRVAVGVRRVVLIKEAQIREVHHDLIADRSADGLERPVSLTVLAVIHGDFVVYITSVDQPGGRSAVAVFVEAQHDGAAPGELNGVSCAGLVIVLIAVQEQHAGGF